MSSNFAYSNYSEQTQVWEHFTISLVTAMGCHLRGWKKLVFFWKKTFKFLKVFSISVYKEDTTQNSDPGRTCYKSFSLSHRFL